MAIDVETLGAAQSYVAETANGLGAVKGANCTVSNISESDGVNAVTFLWTGTDGTEQRETIRVKDGASIVDVVIDSNNVVTCTLSDGTVIDSGSVKVVADADQIPYTNAEDSNVRTVKDALNSLFDEGDEGLEEELTPNVIQGSVKSSYPVGTSWREIIRDMLTEKIPPVISVTINPTATLYDEVTDSINSLTVNATVTKKTNGIAKIEYYVNNVVVKTNTTNVENGGSFPYIYNTLIDDDTDIKVVVTDTEGLSSTATKTIEFIGQSYYGLVDANTGEPTEALVKTLTKKLKNVKKFVYSGITTDWAKICYAYPAELGKLTSIMDKVNNFNYTNSFQLTTKSIDGIEYYVYTLIDPTGADNVTLTFE